MTQIIYDFEFNTAFRIDRQTRRLLKGDAHPECPQEIIEIGAVKLNDQLCIEDTFQMMIKPTLYHKMHPKIRQKTKITAEELQYGVTFPEAIQAFREWMGAEEPVMGSWGIDDHQELERNCRFHKLETKWFQQHLDIQKLCMRHLEMPKGQQVGLKKAVEHFGIELENSFHKALHDAIYTAHVYRALKTTQETGGDPQSKDDPAISYCPSPQ